MDKEIKVKDSESSIGVWTSPNEAKCAAVFSSWFPGEDFTPENLKKVPMKAIREAMTSTVVDEIDFFLREIHAIVGYPALEKSWEELPRSAGELLKVLCKHVRYLISKLEISKSEVKKQLVEVLRAYATEESISEVIDFFFKRGPTGLSTKIFKDMYNNGHKCGPKPVIPVPEEFVDPSIISSLWKADDFRVTGDWKEKTIRAMTFEELAELKRQGLL